jgi:histone H3/H4
MEAMKAQAKGKGMRSSASALQFIRESMRGSTPEARHRVWDSAIAIAAVNGRKTVTDKDATSAFIGLYGCRKGPLGVHRETQSLF